jgi:pyoverdine/dityrosine biosynthesis protein Dit1
VRLGQLRINEVRVKTLYDLSRGSDEDRSFAKSFAVVHCSWEAAQRHWRGTQLSLLNDLREMEHKSKKKQDEIVEREAMNLLSAGADLGECFALKWPRTVRTSLWAGVKRIVRRKGSRSEVEGLCDGGAVSE